MFECLRIIVASVVIYILAYATGTVIYEKMNKGD